MSSIGVAAREVSGVTNWEFALEKPNVQGKKERKMELIAVGQHKAA